MQHDTFHLQALDGLNLFGQLWLPDTEPNAVFCILHGFGGHTGHYENFASFMTTKGYGVYGMDLRGHGQSEGRRGYINSGDQLMDDITELLIETRKNHPELPLFLLGHSMGGNLAAHYILRNRSRELAGVILSSPMFRLAFRPSPWRIAYGNFFSHFFPGMSLSFKGDPSGNSGGTMDPDPLVHNKISYPLFKFCTESGEWNIRNASLNLIPTLLMHGRNDRITSWEASREYAGNSGKNMTFKIWEDRKHELLKGDRSEEVLEFIFSWTAPLLVSSEN